MTLSFSTLPVNELIRGGMVQDFPMRGNRKNGNAYHYLCKKNATNSMLVAFADLFM